jgi:hypothetical protein
MHLYMLASSKHEEWCLNSRLSGIILPHLAYSLVPVMVYDALSSV